MEIALNIALQTMEKSWNVLIITSCSWWILVNIVLIIVEITWKYSFKYIALENNGNVLKCCDNDQIYMVMTLIVITVSDIGIIFY